MKIVDIAGQRFGRLRVIEFSHTKGGRSYWRVRCDCGTEKTIMAVDLRSKHTLSCGCLARELSSRRVTTHGQSGNPRTGLKKSSEYISWQSMIQRCYDQKVPYYKNYGGRGIAVCDRWRSSFEAFLADMGPRPAGKTLDRIDNDGNYEPGNCRWATAKEQRLNQRAAQ